MRGGNHHVRGPQLGNAVQNNMGRGTAGPCGLALAGLLLFAASDAFAQGVDKGGAKPVPGAATAVEMQTESFAAGEPGLVGTPAPVPPPPLASMLNGRPEAWEIYFKGGPIFPLSHGFLEGHMITGWTAQVGMRQPIYRSAGPWMFFAEFGGGYSANSGRANRPVTTSGIAFFPNDDHIHPANDFYDTQLVELQRYFVQGALGVYYYPSSWNSPGDRLVHVNTRLGMRAGGAKAVYANDVQLGLRTIFDAHAGPNGHGHNPALAQFFPDARDPDLFFGLFGSVGASVTYYNKNLFGRTFCDITFSAEIEFAHEWFDTGAYSHHDHGYASFAPMFSVSFSF